MTQEEVDTPEKRRRKAYLLAREIGLSREERLSLAEILLRRDVKTWKGLDDEQITKLLFAMEGHQLILELYRQKIGV